MGDEALVVSAQYRCKKHVEEQWRENASLPEALPHVNFFSTLSIFESHACLNAVVDLRMTGSILGCTSEQAKTSHRRIWSTESYALIRSIKHKYKGASVRASSCSRRYRNTMSTVERWG